MNFNIHTILFGSIVFFLLFSAVSTLRCGKVFDGPTLGKDRYQQQSTSRLYAVWEGFEDGSSTRDRVDYHYAVISSRLATKEINESGWDAPEKDRCRDDSGLPKGKEADLVDFRFGDVGHDTSATITHQRLRPGTAYYVIIRATEGRRTIYSNTDGVIAGRDDDDDDELEPWEQGLIAMACAICCLLILCCLLLLLALLVLKGKGDDKYTTIVHRNENVDKL